MSSKENIRVVCRIRPENKIEKDNKMLLTKIVSINSRINVNKIIDKGF